MYSKNLNINVKVRMSENDYDFINFLSKQTGKNISIVIRELIQKERNRYGYIKTDLDDKL